MDSTDGEELNAAVSRSIDAFGIACAVGAVLALGTGSESPVIVLAPALVGVATYLGLRWSA